MNWFLGSPLALPLRVLSLPVALPLIFLGNTMTNDLNPPADGPSVSFLSAVGQYITGKL